MYSQAPSLSFASSTRQSELIFGHDISGYEHGVNLLPGLGTTRSKTSIKSLQNRPLNHLPINQSGLQQGSITGNNFTDIRMDEATDDHFYPPNANEGKPLTNLSDQPNQLQSRTSADKNLLNQLYGPDHAVMGLEQNLYPSRRGTYHPDTLSSFDFLKQGYLINNEFIQASKPITYKGSDDGRVTPNQRQNKRLGSIYKIFPKGSEDHQDEEDYKIND